MDTEAMIDKLIKKYENIYKNTTVMDDYDGGMMHMVREILADLKRVSDQADKTLLDSLKEEKTKKHLD